MQSVAECQSKVNSITAGRSDPFSISGACRWRSWERRMVVLGALIWIDVKVQQTDAGCELRYLPQATEEDHGARIP
jgi:hypothetical protein